MICQSLFIFEKRKRVFGWFKLDEIVTFTLLVLLKVLPWNNISYFSILLNYPFKFTTLRKKTADSFLKIRTPFTFITFKFLNIINIILVKYYIIYFNYINYHSYIL